MKIFLDIGAHIGETLEVVVDKKYGFDKIYCFEPATACCDIIKATFQDPRVVVCEYGLWNSDCTMPLYNPGDMGASVFKDKPNRHHAGLLNAQFVSASNWFSRYLNFDDHVFVKINCEGSECVILDDVIDSGQYKKIHVLMVDFDVRKIPSQKHLAEKMKAKLSTLAIPKVFYAEDFNFGKGAHTIFTGNWLDLSHG